MEEASKIDFGVSWANRVRERLKGHAIVDVRYLTRSEAEDLGWYGRCVVLILDNSECLFPSMDDEGNGPGALFTTFDGLKTIPVVPL